ncbi:MAG: hypothetical protein LBE20_01800 [Deltaproteobacteria bacterium]|jgi:hypothetical protein|nr:hypothetical protein [Deltaproteobacteria bacterium]
MVTVNSQPLAITIAYLETLGYNQNKAKIVAQTVLEKIKELCIINTKQSVSENYTQNDFIMLLDSFLFLEAKKIFIHDKLKDYELLAFFKFYFILNQVAEYYDFSTELKQDFFFVKDFNLEIIPEYKVSQMRPQKLSSIFNLRKLFSKVLKK